MHEGKVRRSVKNFHISALIKHCVYVELMIHENYTPENFHFHKLSGYLTLNILYAGGGARGVNVITLTLHTAGNRNFDHNFDHNHRSS